MSVPSTVDIPDGLANPHRLLAFSTLAIAVSMAVLDGSIVNVALPTMSHDLKVAPESAIWIVNAFQLAVTVSLLPLSALGDALGYRRVYWCGLAVFTFASLACAVAPTFSALTLARLLQGLGAAGVMSVNIALFGSSTRARGLAKASATWLWSSPCRRPQAQASPPRSFRSRPGDGCFSSTFR